MPLYIDNKKIVPAPFVNIGKEVVFSDDGRPIGSNFRITLNGTLLPHKGSPNSQEFHQGAGEPAQEQFDTDDQKFDSLLRKQELIRELLSRPGFLLTYTANDRCSVNCYPKLRSINFTPGQWVIRSDYSIELESSTINKDDTAVPEDTFTVGSSGLFLTRASDDWQVKERDDGSSIWEVSRVTTAAAATVYDANGIVGTEAWQNAKLWVSGRIASYGIHTNNIFGLPSGLPSNYYNFIDEESVNRLGGSYTRSQRYIFSSGNYIEQRTVSRVEEPSKIGDGGPYITRINVNGRIEGLDFNNSPSGKIVNALAYWNSIRAGLGASVGANGSGITIQHDEDNFNGVVTYAVQFINNTGSTYKHVYDVSFAFNESAFPSVTIAGTIEGVTSDDFYRGNALKFLNAVSGFIALEPTFKALAFAYGTGPLFGASNYDLNFTTEPINKSVQYNKANSTVGYSYTYGWVDGGDKSAYTDQYSVELSTTNAPSDTAAGLTVSATINGTIIGLGDGTDDPAIRMTNAAVGWATVKSLLYTRCNSEVSKIGSATPSLNGRTITRAVGLNRPAGQITYSATYNNFVGPSHTGVAILDYTIDEVFQQDIIAIQAIPGRASGPIIQNIGTKSEQRRNLNLAMTMYPKNGGAWGIGDRSTIRAIASGYLASGITDLGSRGSGWFLAGKTENWDWKNGLYQTAMNVVLVSGLE